MNNFILLVSASLFLLSSSLSAEFSDFDFKHHDSECDHHRQVGPRGPIGATGAEGAPLSDVFGAFYVGFSRTLFSI